MYYTPPEVDLGNEEIRLSERKRLDTSDSLLGYDIGISTPERVSRELLDQHTSLYNSFYDFLTTFLLKNIYCKLSTGGMVMQTLWSKRISSEIIHLRVFKGWRILGLI